MTNSVLTERREAAARILLDMMTDDEKREIRAEYPCKKDRNEAIRSWRERNDHVAYGLHCPDCRRLHDL